MISTCMFHIHVYSKCMATIFNIDIVDSTKTIVEDLLDCEISTKCIFKY